MHPEAFLVYYYDNLMMRSIKIHRVLRTFSIY